MLEEGGWGGSSQEGCYCGCSNSSVARGPGAARAYRDSSVAGRDVFGLECQEWEKGKARRVKVGGR